MKYNKKTVYPILFLSVLIISKTTFSEVRLPRLISDGMVLQRNSAIKVWGWASKGEEITIRFMDKTYNTTADDDGNWIVTLSTLDAGGSHCMEINASNHIAINNILIGDVWVCSGQSNMVLTMDRVKDRYADVIANSDNPAIRQFLVPMRYDFNQPQVDVTSGSWESANPEDILHFSATGYFFAKTLYEKYQVPIGLINASVGGSPAEAWLSEDALQAFPAHLDTAIRFKDSHYVKQIIEKDKAISDAWFARIRQLDEGLKGEKPWFDPAYDASSWQSMPIPSYWEDEGLGPVNGVVWFRKEIHIPASMIDESARLLLGRIVDSDSVYINGIFVGTTSYQYPPRRYEIPKYVLKAGKNIIVIRVINNSGRGGFIPDKPYRLIVGGHTIDLQGEWQYKLGAAMDPLPDPTFIRWKPLGLYNGMIAPLLNYKIKGVIAYITGDLLLRV